MVSSNERAVLLGPVGKTEMGGPQAPRPPEYS
jgi:hypothetical protein